jgi:cell division protein FtsA
MAREFKGSADRRLIAALDIGASKVACVIAQLTEAFDGEFEVDVVGVGQHGAGLRDKAADLDAAIRACVEAAERMAGERIRHVYAAAAGRSLTTRRVGVDLDIDGGVITREDVADCLAQGSSAAAPEGATALHAFKVRYAVDGEPAPEDPAGLSGSVLNAEIFGIGVKDSYLANVESMLARASLELEEVVAGPYAASEAVLIDDEKELGVLLLDIGARSTSYALFERGALISCGGVGVGGEHITRDIAQIFGSPIAHAERMKTLHGSVLTGPGDEHRLLDFPQLGDAAEIARHSKAELSQVIAPRFEEILEMSLAALPGGANARRSVRRAVLTGGGSLLLGARETAERVVGVKTRLGRPAPLSGAPEAATAPQFAVAFGVLRHVARQRSQHRRAVAQPRLRSTISAGRGLIGGVGQWLKANF